MPRHWSRWTRSFRWVAAVFGLLLVLLVPRVAGADASTAHSVSVAVLSFDSDDAEDQADALTGALRSRIRASQGWSLIETSQSLGMLTAALRCPGKPIPAECEQRIADQIRSERYIFGYVTKGPQANQVTAQIHLYQKSKPDTVIRESYADNLKDQNDDTLRRIAQRVLDRLGGIAVGTIVVKMGSENGEVVIDGDKRVPMQNGVARLELAPGSHAVEIANAHGTGGPQRRNVLVTAGKETVVDLGLSGATMPTEPPKPEKPFPTRKVVGGALLATGIGAGVVSVVMALKYGQDQDDGKAANQAAIGNPNQVSALPPGKTADDACGSPGFNNTPLCNANEEAKTHSAIALVTGIAGGALILGGAYFLFTRGSEGKAAASASGGLKSVKASPTFGQGTGGFALSGSF